MTTKAFILCSGGMDSATLLAKAIKEFGQHNTRALSINYGQLHREKELAMAVALCRHYGVEHEFRNIQDSIGKGGLSDPDMKVPDISYSEIQGVSPTYVPFRNGLLLSTITSLAAGYLGQNPDVSAVVGYGAHSEDAANWAYPDCTPEFIGSMANAIYVGSYHKIRLYTPLMWMKKSEIAWLGYTLDVPYELTWSCYKGGEVHCGMCPTCRARKQAFIEGEVVDPTTYAQ